MPTGHTLPLAALDPGLRGTAAQGARGKAGWPGFYRHSATDLADRARGSDPQPQSSSLALPCQILVSVDGCRSLTAYGGCIHRMRASSRRPAPRTARHGRAGRTGDMQVGWGFTAARRNASRLAQGTVSLDPGLRAVSAQGTWATCRLDGVRITLADVLYDFQYHHGTFCPRNARANFG